jgi:hypothetical protein
MKRGFFLSLSCALIGGLCAAQGAGPFSYSLSLSPSLDGTVNARIDLGMRWLPWLSSALMAQTDDSVVAREDSAGASTLITKAKSVSLTALKVDQELLWGILGTRLDFLEFSVGIVGAYDLIEQSGYGYPLPLPGDFFLESSRTSRLRPLQSYALGLRLGPLSVNGFFQSTVYWSTETVTSSSFDSGMGSVPSPASIDYQGGDTYAGGELGFDMGFAALDAGFAYYRHVMTDGTVANTSMDQEYRISGGVKLSFIEVGGGNPYLGMSYVIRDVYWVAQDANVKSESMRFMLGVR